jgi:hypothetical protein
MIRKISLEIKYEISGKMSDEIHLFYILDKFTGACNKVIDELHSKRQNDISLRVARAIDEPSDIFKDL